MQCIFFIYLLFILCLGEQLDFHQWNASSKLWIALLQNQRIIHQQLLDIQHKHEALEKRLTNIIEKSDWYKVSISFNGMGWVESKRTFKLDRQNKCGFEIGINWCNGNFDF